MVALIQLGQLYNCRNASGGVLKIISRKCWYLTMMSSTNGNIFRVTGHLCGGFTGEFPSQRPVTRNFAVCFDLCLDKRLSKQSRGWWFETPSRSLWRNCNAATKHDEAPTVRIFHGMYYILEWKVVCYINVDQAQCCKTKSFHIPSGFTRDFTQLLGSL